MTRPCRKCSRLVVFQFSLFLLASETVGTVNKCVSSGRGRGVQVLFPEGILWGYLREGQLYEADENREEGSVQDDGNARRAEEKTAG